jgi:hypothetical protein
LFDGFVMVSDGFCIVYFIVFYGFGLFLVMDGAGRLLAPVPAPAPGAWRPAPGAGPPALGPGRALAPGAWRNPKIFINPTAFLENLQNTTKNTQPMRSTNKSATGKSQEIIRCTHKHLFICLYSKNRTGWSTCPQEFIQNRSVELAFVLRLFAKTRGQVDLSVQTNQTNI